MLDDQWVRLCLLGALFCFSAFFSGSETALMSLDRLRIKYLVQKKQPGARQLESLLDQPDRLLGAILVGNNLVNIAASVFATGFFVHLFGDEGELVTILVLTPLLLLFAEVCPKTYAARFPEKVSFKVLRPILAVMWLLHPVVWLVTAASRIFTRLLKGEEDRPIISEDEIRTLITVGEESGVVAKEQRRMLHGIFELSQTRVRDVMIPRTEVIGIEASTPFEEILAVVQEARHSRFPVYEGSIDKVVGVIHSKDILRYVGTPEAFNLGEICRPPYFVPESKRIETLLQSFRKRRIHLAVVVDEYGGVEGIVTLEDVVEEIVGEIRDEYDIEEAMVREIAPGRFLVEASVSLRDVNRRFSLELSEEHANTLAGFLVHLVGDFPKEGEEVEHQGVVFRVRKVIDRRVDKVEIDISGLPKDD